MDPNGGGSHSARDSSPVDFAGIPPSPALRPSNTHQRWGSDNGLEEPWPSEDPSLRDHPSFADAYTPLRDPNDDDDDRVRLIGETQPKVDPQWSTDPERSAGFTSRTKQQYIASTPLKDTIINTFHHASMRVAGIRGDGPYIPLQEEGEHPESTLGGVEQTMQHDAAEKVDDPSQHLRGHALGFLGRTNPLRVRLYKLLIHPYVCSSLCFHSLTLQPGMPNQRYLL